MGRKKTPGIYPAENGDGWQINAVYKGNSIRRRGFNTAEEAESILIAEKEQIRRTKLLGETQRYTLDQAAAYYIKAEAERGKVSLPTDISLLKRVVTEVGELTLDRISHESLQKFINACKQDGLKNKSINNALGVVIRICNLASRAWRDENGNPWLAVPPLIRKLDLEDQRPPRPITWSEQKALMPLLPAHLAKMTLFDLQTGLRESVVCELRWEWEVRVPLGQGLVVSAFVVPKKHVKGRKGGRVVVCNSVAQSIIDSERGKHPERVFTYRRERVKHKDREPAMPYRPIASMNNTAWQRSRKDAELGDLHVHDLRHTVGMRLREAGVLEDTISDILWHSKKTMTAHYSAAQVREIYQAVELIKSEANQINVSLLSLVRGDGFYQNPTSKEKGLKKQAS